MKAFFQNKNKTEDSNEILDPIAQTKNWYSDKYETVILQRNILFLFIIFSMLIIIVGIFTISLISTSKTIDPFIVEIEDKTGITTVVNPLTRHDLTTNQALNSYFIIKFLKAYETYSKFELENNLNIVRVLSSNAVYNNYKRYLRDADSPLNKYGVEGTTSLKMRSVIFKSDNIASVRFSIIEDVNTKKIYNKIAEINFTYNQTEMKDEERQINPLGFQITTYVVSDENL